jgi:hypothetical protein
MYWLQSVHMVHESAPNPPEPVAAEVLTSDGLPPVDLRWFIGRCGLTEDNSCRVGEDRKRNCYGCLGKGFSVDLTAIGLVVAAHPEKFGQQDSFTRGPDAPKPWDPDYDF